MHPQGGVGTFDRPNEQNCGYQEDQGNLNFTRRPAVGVPNTQYLSYGSILGQASWKNADLPEQSVHGDLH